jgi:hypothetical protein
MSIGGAIGVVGAKILPNKIASMFGFAEGSTFRNLSGLLPPAIVIFLLWQKIIKPSPLINGLVTGLTSVSLANFFEAKVPILKGLGQSEYEQDIDKILEEIKSGTTGYVTSAETGGGMLGYLSTPVGNLAPAESLFGLADPASLY